MPEIEDFSPGGLAITTDYAFLSPFDLVKPEKMGKLVYPYGRRYVTMLEWGEEAVSSNLTYDHYYRERVKSKVKATTDGGAASSAVTFNVHADAQFSYPYDNDPAQVPGTTASQEAMPVRVQDVIMLTPDSGISSDTMIYATVTAIDLDNFTFDAIVHGSVPIPEITSAQEIVVLHSQMGEGGKLPEPIEFTTGKLSNSMMTTGHRVRATNIAGSLGFWVEEGVSWTIDGTDEQTQFFLSKREMMMLLGDRVTNTALSNWYGNNGYGKLHVGSGLFPEIWDRAHEFNYSSVTGPDLPYFQNISLQLNKHKGARVNLLNQGMVFKSRTNEFLNDYFQEGAVTYGNFTSDEDKFVSFDWKRYEVDGYHYVTNVVEAMNDMQQLGAANFPFNEEGWLQPDEDVNRPTDMDGGVEVGPPVRMRTLKGSSTKMRTEFYDGMKQAKDGDQIQEVRYRDTRGIEAFCMNQWAWLGQN